MLWAKYLCVFRPDDDAQTFGSFADAMVQHGFADPFKPPSVASRSATAVAVILGGSGNAGGGSPVTSPLSWPSLQRPSSPLFAAVLLLATGAKRPSDGDAPAAGAGAPVGPAADANDASVAARRVAASACTALHGLLRCSGNTAAGGGGGGDRGCHDGTGNDTRRGDSTTADTAIAAAQAVAPCLEAFLSLCWSKSEAAAPSSGVRPTSWRGGVVAPAGGGEDVGLWAERERDPDVAEAGWREAYQAASSLLDFVDGVPLKVDTPAPFGRSDRRQGGDVRQFQLTADHRSGKLSAAGKGVLRLWAEVRGLCRREKEARVATSRRLASMLKGSAEAEGRVSGGVASGVIACLELCLCGRFLCSFVCVFISGVLCKYAGRYIRQFLC